MTGKKKLALALLAAGAALGAVGARAEMTRLAAERAAAAAAANPGAETEQPAMKEERHRLEGLVLAAAQVRPLLAALENQVDGATLVDLFQSEDWWRDIRVEFSLTRLVVGSEVLATFGAPDPGTNDRAVVAEARKNPVASAIISLDTQPYFVLASRLAALSDRSPVLVLMKPVAPSLRTPVSAVSAPSPRQPADFGFLAGAALFVLGGGALFIGARSTTTATVPPPANREREDTLRFHSTATKRAAPQFGAGGPRISSSTAPVSVRSEVSAGASAPVPFRVGVTPGPVGPPRHATAPGGVPVTEAGKPGQTFGRYQLLDRLGQGGMADVFTAVAHGVEGFSRVFVLKRLRPELSQDKEAVAQFIDEARMQSNLVHSNIVPVFDFGRVANEYFMTQEYIVGRDLVRLIARYYDHAQQTLSPRLGYYIAHETLQALQYAHQRRDREGNPLGIVHRDVSAGNIIMSAQGEVKLADFGIVKSNRRVSKTQMGMVKGNANFMSPEQARGQAVDARADLFSVALVLYYCLTNRLFYDGDNDLDVLYKAASGPTPQDYQAIACLPAPACDLLGRALAPDPADRFQTAAEFADMLAPHIGGAKAEAARLMQTLFGDEFSREAA
ncbi:MAG: serine/threonine-protein kinase [Pseudomonadota bacterium]